MNWKTKVVGTTIALIAGIWLLVAAYWRRRVYRLTYANPKTLSTEELQDAKYVQKQVVRVAQKQHPINSSNVQLPEQRLRDINTELKRRNEEQRVDPSD